MKTATTKCHVRAMTSCDLDAVLEIGRNCFEQAWEAKDWLHFRDRMDAVALVATVGKDVAGFMTYQFLKRGYLIESIAVDPFRRSAKVGTALVKHLQLDQIRRAHCLVQVLESQQVALVFFKAVGFRAVQLVRGPDEDVIVMRRMFCD